MFKTKSESVYLLVNNRKNLIIFQIVFLNVCSAEEAVELK